MGNCISAIKEYLPFIKKYLKIININSTTDFCVVAKEIEETADNDLITLCRSEGLSKVHGPLSLTAGALFLKSLSTTSYDFKNKKREETFQHSDLNRLIDGFKSPVLIDTVQEKLSIEQAFARTDSHRMRFDVPHVENIASSILETIQKSENDKLEKFNVLLERSSLSEKIRLCDMAKEALIELAKGKIAFPTLQEMSILHALRGNPQSLPEFVELSEFFYALFDKQLKNFLKEGPSDEFKQKYKNKKEALKAHKEKSVEKVITFMEVKENATGVSVLLQIMTKYAGEIGVGSIDIEVSNDESIVQSASLLKFSKETAFLYHYTKHPPKPNGPSTSCDDICGCKTIPIEILQLAGGQSCQEIRNNMENYLNLARENIKSGLIRSSPGQIDGYSFIYGNIEDTKAARTYVKTSAKKTIIASYF